jgi:hypothetical protein
MEEVSQKIVTLQQSKAHDVIQKSTTLVYYFYIRNYKVCVHIQRHFAFGSPVVIYFTSCIALCLVPEQVGGIGVKVGGWNNGGLSCRVVV